MAAPVITKRRRVVIGLAVPAALAVVAACTTQPSINRRPHSGSATASTVAGVQTITVTAGNTYRFDPSTITVHPGPVKLTLVNDGSGAPHDWTLLGLPGAATTEIGSNTSTSVTFTTPAPGKYEFVCTIHQKQGQTGTLVVLNR
jgi:plastocyanin